METGKETVRQVKNTTTPRPAHLLRLVLHGSIRLSIFAIEMPTNPERRLEMQDIAGGTCSSSFNVLISHNVTQRDGQSGTAAPHKGSFLAS